MSDQFLACSELLFRTVARNDRVGMRLPRLLILAKVIRKNCKNTHGVFGKMKIVVVSVEGVG